MPIKINKLEIENVKRVKAVKMEPSANGLTIIGGNNAEGKTSVLDAIAWALGGNSFKPSEPVRRGSATAPYLKVTMSNGLVVERKGKNSALVVTDPSGMKAGQQLLDCFVEKLALDLPKFMQANDKEKANTLLNIIGVGEALESLEEEEKHTYQERTAVGRIADQKKKFAAEQPYYPDAPKEAVSIADLVEEYNALLGRNEQRRRWQQAYEARLSEVMAVEAEINKLEEAIGIRKAKLKDLQKSMIAAQKTPAELKMESTDEIENRIAHAEEINDMVRANESKDRAEEEANEYKKQYEVLNTKVDEIRRRRTMLLNDADLPLPDLGVKEGRLTYKGQLWDNMSGAEQLIVATAIVRRLNPKCGFVLMDKLEQMDKKTLKEFGTWLEQEGLQVIATRVSTGDECQIIIEDGMGVSAND